MIQLAVAGATGRMGRAVLELALRDERFSIAAALSSAGCPLCGSTLLVADRAVPVVDRLAAPCDVLIDFTVPSGTMAWLEVCQDLELPMVIGTTGHSEEEAARIREAAAAVTIVKTGNFSPGMNVILSLLGQLTREVGDAFDIELVETHHRWKRDAPSGTALMLVDEILAATGGTRERDVIIGRIADAGSRSAGQIGVHSVRMGDVVGRHEIHFSGPGETITIAHTSQSRKTFAAGALRAAAWIVGKQPGLYSMRDVLG